MVDDNGMTTYDTREAGFGAVFFRELRFLKRDTTFSISIVFIPIITMFFLVALFYKGVPDSMPVAVVDLDNSPLSRQMIQMIDATSSVDVAYEISSLEEGRNMMKKGDVSAVVVVPTNFQRSIYNGDKVDCSAFISGLNILVGSLLERDITTAVKSFSAGIEMQKLLSMGKSSKQVEAISMPIYYDKHILFNPYTSYAYYLLPGFMPMMILLMILLASAYAFGIELKERSAKEWLSASGDNILVATFAKMLPYTLISIGHLFLMNYLMYDFLAVPLVGSKEMLLVAGFVFLIAYQMLGIFFVAVFANMRLAMSLSAGYGVLAFSFSGLTFPFMAMSPFVAACGNLFPLTFYMNVFIDQAMRGAPLSMSYIDIAILLVFIFVALLSLFRLRTVAQDEQFWGRS